MTAPSNYTLGRTSAQGFSVSVATGKRNIRHLDTKVILSMGSPNRFSRPDTASRTDVKTGASVLLMSSSDDGGDSVEVVLSPGSGVVLT